MQQWPPSSREKNIMFLFDCGYWFPPLIHGCPENIVPSPRLHYTERLWQRLVWVIRPGPPNPCSIAFQVPHTCLTPLPKTVHSCLASGLCRGSLLTRHAHADPLVPGVGMAVLHGMLRPCRSSSTGVEHGGVEEISWSGGK